MFERRCRVQRTCSQLFALPILKNVLVPSLFHARKPLSTCRTRTWIRNPSRRSFPIWRLSGVGFPSHWSLLQLLALARFVLGVFWVFFASTLKRGEEKKKVQQVEGTGQCAGYTRKPWNANQEVMTGSRSWKSLGQLGVLDRTNGGGDWSPSSSPPHNPSSRSLSDSAVVRITTRLAGWTNLSGSFTFCRWPFAMLLSSELNWWRAGTSSNRARVWRVWWVFRITTFVSDACDGKVWQDLWCPDHWANITNAAYLK